MPKKKPTKAPAIESIGDYLNALRGFDTFIENTALWFRGETKIGRELTPTLLRSPYNEKARDHEGDFTALFREHAPAYLKNPPNSWLDWQILMQHHACPTRLLDWTESALVALYFAVKNLGLASRGDQVDGVVYVLDAHRLSSETELNPDGNGIVFTADNLRGSKHAQWMRGGRFELPIPFVPTYNTPRALAQKSRFTLFPFDGADFSHPALNKLVIPYGKKEFLFWQLKTAGVTATTVYPDLDGLARELRSTFSHGKDTGW